MAEDIKGLIEKIHQEGIMAAEEKASEIERQAVARAEAIVEAARDEASKMASEAKEEIARAEETANASLKHAARDLLIALRRELGDMLNRLVVAKVNAALDPKQLAKIITSLIEDYGNKPGADIRVSLKKEDQEALKKVFLGELKEETKKEITLDVSDDISGGFSISFDGGRSRYDFTDLALAQYLGALLNPALAEILERVAAQDAKN